MTSDSRLFPPRPQWEAKGYRADEYSRWLLGDWRPIDELWKEMDIDPSRPQPAEVELEDWLFDTTAGPERRAAEARFVHGHLLKPGDVARTAWRNRCAKPPYDRLPIPRADIPAGVILSRDGDTWIREENIEDTALPLYEGRMIGQFDFSQKGWVSGRDALQSGARYRGKASRLSRSSSCAQVTTNRQRPRLGVRNSRTWTSDRLPTCEVQSARSCVACPPGTLRRPSIFPAYTAVST